ncbi:MAG: hypothetical protein ACNS62_17470 [Candidatus Cyclobacteriaceae bacterium M3_2C_046]
MIELDHIIIFSTKQGLEADELVNYGLCEGSSRIHPGQGTRNRKFYFKNLYLEILWMHDEEKIKNPAVAPTQLWQRVNHKSFGLSPFGLGLKPGKEADQLFSGSVKYQPVYFPEGTAFEVLTHQSRPYLPWTFRMPFLTDGMHQTEPVSHKTGIEEVTRVIFTVPEANFQNPFSTGLTQNSLVTFKLGSSYGLILEFDHKKQGKEKAFDQLPLTLAC